MDDRKPAWVRWGGVALGALAAVLIALWLRDILVGDKPARKPSLQQITLVRPPPPPPKPPEEKPPEPEVKDEVKIDQPQETPEPQADAPPPGPDLGVDAEGSGSGDGFGLVGKKGAGDLIGGGGNPWAWYDALVNEAVNSAFQAALAREKALKNKSYKVIVKVWLDSSGKVERAQLVDSTGDAKTDEVLKNALNGMRALRDGPPADMPQPMKIRVTSRA